VHKAVKDKQVLTGAQGSQGQTGAQGAQGVQGPGSVSGTQNFIAKFTNSTTVGNSQFFDSGTTIGIGTQGSTNSLTIATNGANPAVYIYKSPERCFA